MSAAFDVSIDELVQLRRLSIEARGDHPALAAVRATLAEQYDLRIEALRAETGRSYDELDELVDAIVDGDQSTEQETTR